MNADELSRRFCNDEGAGGARAALDFLNGRPAPASEAEFNVWYLRVAADSPDTVDYAHAFDPHQGSVSLADFVAGVTAYVGETGTTAVVSPGKSRFGADIDEARLHDYVDEATRRGEIDPDEPGTITCDLGRIIGIDVAGEPTSIIRVHIRDGAIRTAYPV